MPSTGLLKSCGAGSDLFAGIDGRPPDFDVSLLVPYTIAQAFYLRLRGAPPKALAA